MQLKDVACPEAMAKYERAEMIADKVTKKG